MQKPILRNGLAFVFCVSLLFSCETYNPKAMQVQNRQNIKQVSVKDSSPQVQTIEDQDYEKSKKLEPGLPTLKPNEQVVKHFAYTLSYNEEHEIANWVYYTLKADYLNGKEKRTDDFRADPAVRTQSSDPDDYKLSGYDRGHLVPAGDMKWSKKAMSESFLMSNIAPQTHAFNAGIWETLESLVRSWAKKDSQLYIVTGPVLQGNLQIIGKNKVTVPEYFYKAVLDAQAPEIKSIAFIIPMTGKGPVMNYAVSIDSLESLIRTDIFPGLPDDIENNIEKNFSKKDWKALPKKPKKSSKKY